MNSFNLGVLSDIHGNYPWIKNRLQDFADLDIKLIVQLGDWGGLWPGNASDKFLYRVNKILTQNDQTILIVLGNHEDYVKASMLQPIHEGEFKDFRWNKKYDRIKYFYRGQKFALAGVNFLAVGGANSIDRDYRVPNESWWPGEQISQEDIALAIKNSVDGVDVMLSHDAPIEIPLFTDEEREKSLWSNTQINYANKSRYALSKIVQVAQPKLILHGHYHFLADHTVAFNKNSKSEFISRSVGLDCDENKNNIAVLELPSLNLDLIPYKL